MKSWGIGMVAVLCNLTAVLAAPVPPPPKEPNYGPVTAKQREQAVSNLKQIGLAIQNYHDTFMKLPGNIASEKGTPLLSWRVAILPYLEEGELYKQFKLDESWDSENNKKLIEKLPNIYAPIRVKAKPGETFYLAFSGKDAWLRPAKEALSLPTIRDGSSNTVAVVEAGEPVVWSKPEDIAYDPKKALPKLGGHFDGEVHILFHDGHVIRAKKDFNRDVFKKMITPDGGEVFDFDDFVKD